MVNVKIGGILLVSGAILFLLSDTLFGDSEATSYAIFFGVIMFPLGLILTLVGLIQALIEKVKNRPK
jgi:predicted phage tail protein